MKKKERETRAARPASVRGSRATREARRAPAPARFQSMASALLAFRRRRCLASILIDAHLVASKLPYHLGSQ